MANPPQRLSGSGLAGPALHTYSNFWHEGGRHKRRSGPRYTSTEQILLVVLYCTDILMPSKAMAWLGRAWPGQMPQQQRQSTSRTSSSTKLSSVVFSVFSSANLNLLAAFPYACNAQIWFHECQLHIAELNQS